MDSRKIIQLLCVIAMLFATSAQADLVAAWSLNDNGNDALGTHNGIPTGGVSFDGNNATFTGNGSIDVPYDAALNPASFSVSVWAKSSNGSGHRSVITNRKGDIAGQQTGFILYEDPGNNWNFWTGTPGSWAQLSGGPVAINTLTHLTLTYDGTNGQKSIYVNGVLANSAVQAYTPNPDQGLHIGGGGDTGGSFRFLGDIDDVGLWNYPLTAIEVVDVMNNGISDQVGVTPPVVFGNDLTIHNGSFEDVTNLGSGFNSAGSGHVANWFNITNGANSNDGANVGAQVRSPGAAGVVNNFPDGQGADGDRVGHINAGAVRSLVQNLDASFAQGFEYTLDLNIGRRLDHDVLNLPSNDWIVSFHDQITGDLLASIEGSTIVGHGGFLDAQQLVYTATAADAGKGIQIRLTNPTPGGGGVNFDQVSLSVVVPEPGTFVLLGFGVAMFARRRKIA